MLSQKHFDLTRSPCRARTPPHGLHAANLLIHHKPNDNSSHRCRSSHDDQGYGTRNIYKVLLEVAFKLTSSAPASPNQPEPTVCTFSEAARIALAKLAHSKPELISVPFISWVASLEGRATGPEKQRLGAICQQLVILRETLDQERLDTLYSDTVAAITAHVEGRQPDPSLLLAPTITQPGTSATISSTPSTTQASSSHPTSSANPRQEGLVSSGTHQASPFGRGGSPRAALDVVRDPTAYAIQLSEVVTGETVQMQGYGQVMDALVRLVPPAALTPQGVAEAHRQARELGEEVRGRRKRTVAAMIGRARLTPDQADALMAGTAASRILDLLLSLPTHEARLELLPDCFTPPSHHQQPPQQQQQGQRGQQGQQGQDIFWEMDEGEAPADEGGGSDELWCTPAQLLNEVDSRLAAIDKPQPYNQDGGGGLGGPMPALPGAPGALAGPELRGALQQLRERVWEDFMRGMGEKLQAHV